MSLDAAMSKILLHDPLQHDHSIILDEIFLLFAHFAVDDRIAIFFLLLLNAEIVAWVVVVLDQLYLLLGHHTDSIVHILVDLCLQQNMFLAGL